MIYMSIYDEDIPTPFQKLTTNDIDVSGGLESGLDEMYEKLKNAYLKVKSDDSELIKFYKEN